MLRRTKILVTGISFIALSMSIGLLTGAMSDANAAAAFYEGKVVRIIVSGTGSAYDLYSRVLAAFLPAHIPGHPTVIIQYMAGANGLVSANYMYNVAPRDGTVFASGVSSLPISPLLHPDIDKINVTKFSWIGNMDKDVYVAFVWNSAPIQTYDDLKRTEVIMGGITVGAASVDLAMLSNALFGTKMKIVSGYENQVDVQAGN